MPAYNAGRTLRQTYSELRLAVVDEVLLVDDASSDETVELAQELGLKTFLHEKNLGYGKNQKTCYREALKGDYDIVIMLHPDYKLSEYHTGFRAFTREALKSLPLEENTNDFLLDNELLAQAIYFRFRIGEISGPTKYFPEASSITFTRSVRYGLGVLLTSLKFRIQKAGLAKFRIFDADRGKLLPEHYRQIVR